MQNYADDPCCYGNMDTSDLDDTCALIVQATILDNAQSYNGQLHIVDLRNEYQYV